MHTPRTGDEAAAARDHDADTEPELLSDTELEHLHEFELYDLPPLGEFDDWLDIAALPPLPDPPGPSTGDAA